MGKTWSCFFIKGQVPWIRKGGFLEVIDSWHKSQAVWGSKGSGARQPHFCPRPDLETLTLPPFATVSSPIQCPKVPALQTCLKHVTLPSTVPVSSGPAIVMIPFPRGYYMNEMKIFWFSQSSFLRNFAANNLASQVLFPWLTPEKTKIQWLAQGHTHILWVAEPRCPSHSDSRAHAYFSAAFLKSVLVLLGTIFLSAKWACCLGKWSSAWPLLSDTPEFKHQTSHLPGVWF